MIQAIVKKGRVLPVEVPAPVVSPGALLIKVVSSCISAGTEVSGVQQSGKSLIRRALEQPENVRKVLDLARSEGIASTFAKVRGKLGTGSPTGYSLSGVVLAAGEGVTDFAPGDRVAAAGAGIANHAELVDVPRNLVMRIPEGLDYPEAATVTLGGIAMQGVRRAQVQMGEFVLVLGTGILGQLAVQMLAVSGARVIALDLDPERLELARSMGAELCLSQADEVCVRAVHHFTHGRGVDAVLFCAATGDPQVLSDAFAMTRAKGRVIMVGVWGRELKREDIYRKELDFLISTSYGPGRYDPEYEEKGVDYPYAYVRWTENRNMEEYLRLLATGRVDVRPLIQSTYPIRQVEAAFKSLSGPERPLMVLLDYGEDLPTNYAALAAHPRQVPCRVSTARTPARRVRTGLIGAGEFALGVHLPNLRKLKDRFEIGAICSRTGHKAQAVAEQSGARYATTDYREVLADPDIDLVMICVRHNLHGKMVLESLEAGKHTFVEKPLCTSRRELEAIRDWYSARPDSEPSPLLMVGFNRRFSKAMQEVKKHVARRVNPVFLHYRMNAGYIAPDHWVHGAEGGGRIIGEACHIIDLFSYLVDAPVRSYGAVSLGPRTGSVGASDNKGIMVEYEDGSVATLDYFAVGSGDLPKEWLEAHFDEKTIVVDDFKAVRGYGIPVEETASQVPQKGQLEELEEVARFLRGERRTPPIDLKSLFETTEITLELG